MIKTNEYGTYGYVYLCPVCGKEHGSVIHHITKQLPMLCDKCLYDDSTDANLRIKTLIYRVMILEGCSEEMDDRTSGLKRFG